MCSYRVRAPVTTEQFRGVRLRIPSGSKRVDNIPEFFKKPQVHTTEEWKPQ